MKASFAEQDMTEKGSALTGCLDVALAHATEARRFTFVKSNHMLEK